MYMMKGHWLFFRYFTNVDYKYTYGIQLYCKSFTNLKYFFKHNETLMVMSKHSLLLYYDAPNYIYVLILYWNEPNGYLFVLSTRLIIFIQCRYAIMSRVTLLISALRIDRTETLIYVNRCNGISEFNNLSMILHFITLRPNGFGLHF